MNHIYRVVFNVQLGLWQAVCEIARSAGHGASSSSASARSRTGALLLGGVLAVGSTGVWAAGKDGVTVPKDNRSYSIDVEVRGQAGGEGEPGGVGVNHSQNDSAVVHEVNVKKTGDVQGGDSVGAFGGDGMNLINTDSDGRFQVRIDGTVTGGSSSTQYGGTGLNVEAGSADITIANKVVGGDSANGSGGFGLSLNTAGGDVSLDIQKDAHVKGGNGKLAVFNGASILAKNATITINGTLSGGDNAANGGLDVRTTDLANITIGGTVTGGTVTVDRASDPVTSNSADSGIYFMRQSENSHSIIKVEKDGKVRGASSLDQAGTRTYIGVGIALDKYAKQHELENAGEITGSIGISGANLSMINSGKVTGASFAIALDGLKNTLELRAGSEIHGEVKGSGTDGASNRLILGGGSSGDFDASKTYQYFTEFEKNGLSTWTLTGKSTAVRNWTLTEGTLSISDDNSLGAETNTLFLNGGTLQSTGNTSSTRTIKWGGTGGASVAPDGGTTLALNGKLTGDGALKLNGQGTVILGGLEVNSYLGGTTIKNGTLQVGAGGTAGNLGVGDVRNDGTLAFNRSDDVTVNNTISGSGAVIQQGTGTTVLTGSNSYRGGTVVSAGVLQVAAAGALVQNTAYHVERGALLDLNGHALQTAALTGEGRIALGAAELRIHTAEGQSDHVGGQISGSGTLVKEGAGTLRLMAANDLRAGVQLKQGRIDLGHAQGLGSGTLAMDDGTALGLTVEGMTIANDLHMTGSNDPIIDTGSHWAMWSGAISGAGYLTKQGSGTLVLSSKANSYTGATDVAQGTLQAQGDNTLSGSSAHHVGQGAMLDLAGYSQSVASLSNSGTVNLRSHAQSSPGAVLTVTGPYEGQGGTLAMAAVLAGDGSATDKLVLSGPNAVASGSTRIEITNAGGLGAATTEAGIEVVATENGGRLEPGSFSLVGGHVDAGAYEYRLTQTEHGAALSTGTSQVAYRSEVPLLSALPAQLRQADLAMLGDMRKRTGDDGARAGRRSAGEAQELGRRAWARLVRIDPSIAQQGTVSPESRGHMTGFQAGLDLYANQSIQAGLYVGQLNGHLKTNGFTSGEHNAYAGHNSLRSRYLGVYANWQDERSGLYGDAVVQAADYRAQLHTAESSSGKVATTKGHGWLASLEVGQPVALSSAWTLEPQAQLVYRKINLNDTALSLATVKQHAEGDVTLRVGARLKGSFMTTAGLVQPYGRINVYKGSNTTDVARFETQAASTEIKAKGGYTSTELALGASLQLGKRTGLYGELGKLWSNAGDSRVKSGVQASMGLKVLW